MATGNAARTVAATNMNATSSRSHAVFQIFIKVHKLSMSENYNRFVANTKRRERECYYGQEIKDCSY